MKKFDFRRAFGGGGNGDKARVALNLENFVGRYCYADSETGLDAKTPRCEDAKSVTGKMYCYTFLSEGEKEVVNELERILQPQERGWQKLLQIFFTPLSRISNAHNSSQRTATSSLGEVVSQDDGNILTETDHASMPLGIFASKSLAAFTLAEVLITLGIIGVVAALTLSSVIHKYRAEVLRTKFLQANTIVQDGVSQMRAADVDLNEVINNRDLPTLRKYIKGGDCILPKDLVEANYWNYHETYPARGAAATILEQPYCMASGMTLWFVKLSEWNDDKFLIDGNPWVRVNYSLIAVDINGWQQKPNVYGKDVFFWFYDGEKGTLSPTGENININSNVLFYYNTCPGRNSAEAGAGCTSNALSDANYFKKLKL